MVEAVVPPVLRNTLVTEQGSKYWGAEPPPANSSPKFGSRTERW